MFASLVYHPNCLTEDYDNWDAVGPNGKTPLGALWNFQYQLEQGKLPISASGEVNYDGLCSIDLSESNSLHRCNFYNLDMTKEEAQKRIKTALYSYDRRDSIYGLMDLYARDLELPELYSTKEK